MKYVVWVRLGRTRSFGVEWRAKELFLVPEEGEEGPVSVYHPEGGFPETLAQRSWDLARRFSENRPEENVLTELEESEIGPVQDEIRMRHEARTEEIDLSRSGLYFQLVVNGPSMEDSQTVGYGRVIRIVQAGGRRSPGKAKVHILGVRDYPGLLWQILKDESGGRIKTAAELVPGATYFMNTGYNSMTLDVSKDAVLEFRRERAGWVHVPDPTLDGNLGPKDWRPKRK